MLCIDSVALFFLSGFLGRCANPEGGFGGGPAQVRVPLPCSSHFAKALLVVVTLIRLAYGGFTILLFLSVSSAIRAALALRAHILRDTRVACDVNARRLRSHTSQPHLWLLHAHETSMWWFYYA